MTNTQSEDMRKRFDDQFVLIHGPEDNVRIEERITRWKAKRNSILDFIESEIDRTRREVLKYLLSQKFIDEEFIEVVSTHTIRDYAKSLGIDLSADKNENE
jgi:hypothetical protein